jgi:hypothetical protein
MGLTPATGTEIAMGCVYDAFGFPVPTLNISLNGYLGANRQPPQALGVSAIAAGAQTALSSDMGGLTTPDEYCCTLTFWCENADSVLDGWNSSATACAASGISPVPVTAYFTQPTCPLSWQSAVAQGNVIYLSSQLNTPFTSATGWYKTTATLGSGFSFQINGSGIPINLTGC